MNETLGSKCAKFEFAYWDSRDLDCDIKDYFQEGNREWRRLYNLKEKAFIERQNISLEKQFLKNLNFGKFVIQIQIWQRYFLHFSSPSPCWVFPQRSRA